MRAITILFVDQSTSRRLEKIGEDIPTSPEVIGDHTLNFRPKFKFLQLFFSWGAYPLGCALTSLGQSLMRVKISVKVEI